MNKRDVLSSVRPCWTLYFVYCTRPGMHVIDDNADIYDVIGQNFTSDNLLQSGILKFESEKKLRKK